MPLINLLEELCEFGLICSVLDGGKSSELCKGFHIPISDLQTFPCQQACWTEIYLPLCFAVWRELALLAMQTVRAYSRILLIDYHLEENLPSMLRL